MSQDDPRDTFLRSEYGECRAAIGKFDGILTDLRTKGVALVLAFNGAAAIVSQRVAIFALGSVEIRAAAVIQLIALLLIVPLWVLDALYTDFLVMAVNRAEAIEQKFGSDLELAGHGSIRPLTLALEEAVGRNAATQRIHMVLYGVLVALGLFLVVAYQTSATK